MQCPQTETACPPLPQTRSVPDQLGCRCLYRSPKHESVRPPQLSRPPSSVCSLLIEQYSWFDGTSLLGVCKRAPRGRQHPRAVFQPIQRRFLLIRQPPRQQPIHSSIRALFDHNRHATLHVPPQHHLQPSCVGSTTHHRRDIAPLVLTSARLRTLRLSTPHCGLHLTRSSKHNPHRRHSHKQGAYLLSAVTSGCCHLVHCSMLHQRRAVASRGQNPDALHALC